jgi:hypothetical protein
MKAPTPKELGPKDNPREIRMLSRRLTELWKRIDRFTKLAIEIKTGTEVMQDLLTGIEDELVEMRIRNEQGNS